MMTNRCLRLAGVVACFLGWAATGGETVPAADLPALSKVPGGVCLYLDCGDGRALAALARGGKFFVHGLGLDSKIIPATRQWLAKEGVAELTAVDALAPVLPYEKNRVNLIVADDLSALLARGVTLAEIVRVLAPFGGACLGAAAADEAKLKPLLTQCGIKEYRFETGARPWLVFNKPRPAEMDDWSCSFHAADGNLVSRDTYLGGPNQLQWITGPGLAPPNMGFSDMGPLAPESYLPAAQHNNPNFFLSARGRVFSYHTHGVGRIVARDAFSGALLWIKSGIFRMPMSTDSQAAAGDFVFTVSSEGKVVALSAATGEIVRTFDKIGQYSGFKYDDGTLYVFDNARIVAFNAWTGEQKWSVPRTAENGPGGKEKGLRLKSAGSGSVLISGQTIFLRNNANEIVGLDARDGKTLFRKELLKTLGADWWMFRLVADGKAFIHTITPSPNPKTFSGDAGPVGGGKYTATSAMANFHAISGKDGSVLWTRSAEIPWVRYGYAGYVYKAAGLFWFTRWPDDVWDLVKDGVGSKRGQPELDCRPEPPVWVGVDPESGEIKETFIAPPGRMDKCQREVMSERFLMPGEMPYYFIDWKTKEVIKRSDSIWLNCEQVGPLIAQGLLFAFNCKTGCACGKFQTYGFQAWSSDGATVTGEPAKAEHPVEVGGGAAPQAPAENAGDWPTYRHDMQRTAATTVALADGAELTQLWRTAAPLTPAPAALANSMFAPDHQLNLPSRDAITGPTVAGGKVFVSLTHAKQVVALNEADGKVAWTFYAPARLDTPPTLHKGLCLLGCNDGWVYGLNAGDGKLVWRTRAAPAERRMLAYGQVESAWPVVGGVLVTGDTAYALAGRTTEADGGIYVLALNPLTGAPVWPQATRFYQDNPGDLRTVQGANNKSWRQWNATIDPRHGDKLKYLGTADLLGSDGATLQIGCRGYGNIDCKTGAPSPKNCATSVFGRLINLPYTCVASGAPYLTAAFGPAKVKYHRESRFDGKEKQYRQFIRKQGGWELETSPGIVQAVVVAGDKVLAGIADNPVNPKGDSPPGLQKGELWVISTDGNKLAAHPLPAAPAYDGIAIANGKVYVSLTDGSVACLAKK
jgi:outer membrane protein assembly factor BamB